VVRERLGTLDLAILAQPLEAFFQNPLVFNLQNPIDEENIQFSFILFTRALSRKQIASNL